MANNDYEREYMKRILVILIAIALFPVIACASPLQAVSGVRYYTIDRNNAIIFWERNTENDLAGYRLYLGPSSGNYTKTIEVGIDTFYTFNKNIINADTIYAAVTAYDTASNESGYSNEVGVIFINENYSGLPFIVIDASQLQPGLHCIYKYPYMGIYGKKDTSDYACAVIDTFLGSYVFVDVKAHGDKANGEWPIMAIGHDSLRVTTAYDSTYRYAMRLPDTSLCLKIEFTNDYWAPGVADRNLYIRSVTVIKDTTRHVLPIPVPDINRDGTIDGTDLVLFARCFVNNDLKGDFNRDGSVDGGDLIIFVRAFVKQ